jgi:FkbM family methyltransferase
MAPMTVKRIIRAALNAIGLDKFRPTVKRIIRAALNAIGLDKFRPPLSSEHAHLFEAMICSRTPPANVAPFLKYCAQNMHRSHGGRFQDLLVLFLLNDKREGYFVEFGAVDGLFTSNTLLLERDYGWRGIVAEPAKRWHSALKQNRSCSIDERCVWSRSGETLKFYEAPENELSSIDALSNSRPGRRYNVDTVSLADLLREHDAPKIIDYLSMDTEGSELEILKSFFPTEYRFRVITVEHQYDAARQQDIHRLLTTHGYKRIFDDLSMWEDWYIKE